MSEVFQVRTPALPHNLSFSEPPTYGDSQSEMRHVQAVDEQRRTQCVECAVSKGCSVTSLASGRVLSAGDEITLADVGGVQRAMDELVRREVVIRIPRQLIEARTPKKHHTHRVRTDFGGSTISPVRGVLDAGVTCSKEDWAYPPRKGFALPSGELVDAKPADDGQAAIDELVARGILEPLPDAKPTKGGKAA